MHSYVHAGVPLDRTVAAALLLCRWLISPGYYYDNADAGCFRPNKNKSLRECIGLLAVPDAYTYSFFFLSYRVMCLSRVIRSGGNTFKHQRICWKSICCWE